MSIYHSPLRTTVVHLLPLAMVLLIAMGLLFWVLRTPSPWTLDIGTLDDQPFVAGFFWPERDDEITFRWSGPAAQVFLPRMAVGSLHMRLYGNTTAGSQNQHVQLHYAQQPVASFHTSPGWRVYQVIVPEQETRTTGSKLEPLELVVSRGNGPAPMQDGRVLGVPLDWVQGVPRHAGTTVWQMSLHQTLLLTWGLCVLAGLLWQLDQVLFPSAKGMSRSLRVCVLVGMAATGLLFWARQDVYTLTWAWPAPPWVLLLATLILCGTSLRDRFLKQWRLPALLSMPIQNITLILIVLLAHLVLLFPLPAGWRGIAALVLLGVPGVLLALLLFRHERDPLLRMFLGLCGAFVLAVLMLLGLHTVPGPMHGWMVLLAADLLIFGLGWMLWAFDRGDTRRGAAWDAHWKGAACCAPTSIVFLLGGVLRLSWLGNAEFQGDETRALLRTMGIVHGWDQLLLEHDKGPVEILLPAGPLALTGQLSELVARFPFALAGLGVLLGCFLLSRELLADRQGTQAGLIAASILALDGFLIGFARIVQYQSVIMLLMIGALWCGWRFYTGRPYAQHYLIGAASLAAVGLLAHYDYIFVMPALGWLVLAGGWRQGWRGWQWLRGLVGAVLVGASILGSFYIPFALNERFRETTFNYLFWRVRDQPSRSGSLLFNHLNDYYDLATFYNTTFQLNWLAPVLAGGILVWLWRYGRPHKLAAALTFMFATGCVLLVWSPTRFEWAGVNWSIAFFALPLAGLCLSPVILPALRTLLIWFSVPFIAESFLIAIPRTHFYTMAIPAALLIGVACVQLTQWLVGQRQIWLGAILVWSGLATVLLALPYAYLVFVRPVPEFQRSFPAIRPEVYRARYGDTLPTPDGYFGFPHQDGWKVIGELYRQGVLQGSYDSNQHSVITTWYTRGAFRCTQSADYFFVALRERSADRAIQQQIARGYYLVGFIVIDGIRTMDVYRHQPDAHSPRVFDLDTYRHGADNQIIPDFPIQRALLYQAKAPQYDLDAVWQQGIALHGYDLNRQQIATGQQAILSLYWNVQEPLADQYDVHVRIVDSMGKTVGAAEPYCGSTILSSKDLDEPLKDRNFLLRANVDLPPGEYRLEVGLRHTQTGAWLPLADGTNALSLTHVISVVPYGL